MAVNEKWLGGFHECFWGGFGADGRAKGLKEEGRGRSFFCERVVCSCESWTRSCGVEATRVSASGDSVAS